MGRTVREGVYETFGRFCRVRPKDLLLQDLSPVSLVGSGPWTPLRRLSLPLLVPEPLPGLLGEGYNRGGTVDTWNPFVVLTTSGATGVDILPYYCLDLHREVREWVPPGPLLRRRPSYPDPLLCPDECKRKGRLLTPNPFMRNWTFSELTCEDTQAVSMLKRLVYTVPLHTTLPPVDDPTPPPRRLPGCAGGGSCLRRRSGTPRVHTPRPART